MITIKNSKKFFLIKILLFFKKKKRKERLSKKISKRYYVIFFEYQNAKHGWISGNQCIPDLNDKKKAEIPIIAMTANAFEEDKKRAFDAGMNEHIAKPIDIEKLRVAILSVLNKQKN